MRKASRPSILSDESVRVDRPNRPKREEFGTLAHTASLSQLQHPPIACVNGRIVPYEGVRLHVSAEALTRALSVFEGLKGYWNRDSSVFALRSPRRHYQRLVRSATLLHIPVDFNYSQYADACLDLARSLLTPHQDMWFRTTLYVVEGHWGVGTRADLVVTAFHQSKDPAPPMSLGISTWRRSSDAQLPYRIKASANYVMARQARIEANSQGYDDAVLLNEAGRVSEATGACVVSLRDGIIVSPPAYEGALESITLETTERLCRVSRRPFERRPLDRTELLTSEEVAVVGTISELTPISQIDGVSYPTEGVLADLRSEYLEVMRQARRLDGTDFEVLSVKELAAT